MCHFSGKGRECWTSSALPIFSFKKVSSCEHRSAFFSFNHALVQAGCFRSASSVDAVGHVAPSFAVCHICESNATFKNTPHAMYNKPENPKYNLSLKSMALACMTRMCVCACVCGGGYSFSLLGWIKESLRRGSKTGGFANVGSQ